MRKKSRAEIFFEKVALSESRFCPKCLRDRADGQREIERGKPRMIANLGGLKNCQDSRLKKNEKNNC